jgi:hypothetical protein
MKRRFNGFVLCGMFLSLAVLSAAGNVSGAEEKPTVFCHVEKEPDPLLMGSWKTVFGRRTEEGNYETNPVEYRLIKHEDRYAIYFHRISRGGKKQYTGWREWTIKGNEIIADTGVKIVAKDGQVYFIWTDGNPTKMTRVGAK